MIQIYKVYLGETVTYKYKYKSPNLEIMNLSKINPDYYYYPIDSFKKIEINIIGEDNNYLDGNDTIDIIVYGDGKAIPYDNNKNDTINKDFVLNNTKTNIAFTSGLSFLYIHPYGLKNNKTSYVTVNVEKLNLYSWCDNYTANSPSFIAFNGCKKVNVRRLRCKEGDLVTAHYLAGSFCM